MLLAESVLPLAGRAVVLRTDGVAAFAAVRPVACKGLVVAILGVRGGRFEPRAAEALR